MKLSLKLSSSPSSPAPSVVGLPGHTFFCRRLELPAGMQPGEVAGFVDLQLEELSPFPLDHLYFGHVVSIDRAAVLVYAAYRRRFGSEQTASWKDVPVVIPDFAPAIKLTFESETVLYLQSASSLTALHFEANRELPARIVSLPLNSEASPEEIDRAKQKLAATVGVPTADAVSGRVVGHPEERTKGRIFTIEPEDDGEPWEVLIPAAERWTMDVRDASFLEEKRRQLGLDVILWRVLQGAAALIALVVAGEVAMFGARGYAAWLDFKIERQADLASSLEDHDTVARRIVEFEGGDLRPFEMLNLLASSMPDNLGFTTATAVGRNTLEVDATARSVSDINTYRARLNGMPEIERVEIRGERTREEGTSFQAVIVFRPEALVPGGKEGES